MHATPLRFWGVEINCFVPVKLFFVCASLRKFGNLKTSLTMVWVIFFQNHPQGALMFHVKKSSVRAVFFQKKTRKRTYEKRGR